MATLEMAKVLRKVGYGKRGERVGFDLFPYTEDPIEATKQSVLQWEFIWPRKSTMSFWLKPSRPMTLYELTK